jgi:hypothetical protein
MRKLFGLETIKMGVSISGGLQGSTDVLISKETLGSANANFTQVNIPTGYRFLKLLIKCAGTASGETNILMKFNGDAGANYNFEKLYSGGATVTGTSTLNANAAIIGLNNDTPPQSLTSCIIAQDSVFTGHGYLSQSGYQTVIANYSGRWANSALITTIDIGVSASTMIVGSTLEIWGIV